MYECGHDISLELHARLCVRVLCPGHLIESDTLSSQWLYHYFQRRKRSIHSSGEFLWSLDFLQWYIFNNHPKAELKRCTLQCAKVNFQQIRLFASLQFLTEKPDWSLRYVFYAVCEYSHSFINALNEFLREWNMLLITCIWMWVNYFGKLHHQLWRLYIITSVFCF